MGAAGPLTPAHPRQENRWNDHRTVPGGVQREPPPRPFISRTNVAHLMLGVLEQPETIYLAIGIAN
jgi:hypothetical protein